MKKTILSLVALLVLTTSAFAGNVRIRLDGRAEYLPSCGGTVEANSSRSGYGYQANIVLRGVQECSNFIIVRSNGSPVGNEYKLQGSNQNRSGSFTLPSDALEPGYNEIVMRVRSNSGKHSDTVRISVVASNPYQGTDVWVNSYGTSLRECGGTIRATRSNGQINLILDNVRNCSNFVLDQLDREYKIPGNNNNRSGSFTLPASAIEWGYNVVRVTVSSNSGAHKDKILVRFFAF